MNSTERRSSVLPANISDGRDLSPSYLANDAPAKDINSRRRSRADSRAFSPTSPPVPPEHKEETNCKNHTAVTEDKDRMRRRSRADSKILASSPVVAPEQVPHNPVIDEETDQPRRRSRVESKISVPPPVTESETVKNPADEMHFAHGLDSLLNHLGTPGRYQIILYIISCALYFVISPNNLGMVFFASVPTEYLCSDSSFQNILSVTGKDVIDSKVFVEPDVRHQCTVSATWKDRKGQKHTEYSACSNWIFPTVENGTEASTIVSQYGLVCSEIYKGNLATTLYFIGTIIGAPLFGYLGDRFGRRLVVLGSGICCVVVGLSVTASPNYIAFAILRFLLGIVVQGIQVFYVLIMEWLAKQYRALYGTLSECFWGGGVIILALWGYVFPSWKAIQIAIALTGAVILVPQFFLMKESLRWLLVAGKNDDASKACVQVLAFNGKKLDIQGQLHLENQLQLIGNNLLKQEEKLHYTFVDCFRTAKIRKVTIILMYIWFSLALGYYGLSFSLDQMAGHTALNLLIGGLLEMIPYAFCAFAVTRYGRKYPLMALSIVSGICCIVSGVIPEAGAGGIARTVLAQLGRMAVAGSFCSVIVWTNELFPTVIRSNGLGTAMFGLRLGGVLSPQIVLLGHYTFREFPVVCFGVSLLIGAVLAFFLEETLHKNNLPDTIQDVEHAPSRKCSSASVSSIEFKKDVFPTQTVSTAASINDTCIG